MHKKSITIIANENKYRMEPYYRSCQYHHTEGFRNFAYYTGIEIDDSFDDSMYISKQLIEKGFCVILTSSYVEDNLENNEIFIPQTISEEQLKYFSQDKLQEKLSKSSIVVYKQDDKFGLDIISRNTTREPVLTELMNELNNRLAKKPKTRALTKEQPKN